MKQGLSAVIPALVAGLGAQALPRSAGPLPASPALADSIVAFSASSLVWPAILVMTRVVGWNKAE